jgi:hypothetical protein
MAAGGFGAVRRPWSVARESDRIFITPATAALGLGTGVPA